MPGTLLPLVGLFLVLSVVFADNRPSGPIPGSRPAPAVRTTTTTTATTTTAATTTAAQAVAAVEPAPAPSPPPAVTTGCADALAYLAAHQAPGFVDTCADGSALGHYGFSCADVPGMCPGVRIVRIACPAPFVYMNEAHNSWVVIGQGSGIDPFGQGSPTEQTACNAHR